MSCMSLGSAAVTFFREFWGQREFWGHANFGVTREFWGQVIILAIRQRSLSPNNKSPCSILLCAKLTGSMGYTL